MKFLFRRRKLLLKVKFEGGSGGGVMGVFGVKV